MKRIALAAALALGFCTLPASAHELEEEQAREAMLEACVLCCLSMEARFLGIVVATDGVACRGACGKFVAEYFELGN
jgi:hypothetical protein